ncbi:hypothetical protein [Roseovarius amoyensis]|uniref:hypothetical protein n=1 Tax=Roseovarius amoyensis TaxID=2211448 RepID=UPI0013A6F2CD|nr:hypothetical protein [Roseovarius amoyensis]
MRLTRYYTIALSMGVLWVSMAFVQSASARISDACYIDPKARMPELIEQLLGQLGGPSVFPRLADGVFVNHTQRGAVAHTLELMLLNGTSALIYTRYNGRGPKEHSLDWGPNGWVDEIKTGQRRYRPDFQAQTHYCDALEKAGRSWAYQKYD